MIRVNCFIRVKFRVKFISKTLFFTLFFKKIFKNAHLKNKEKPHIYVIYRRYAVFELAETVGFEPVVFSYSLRIYVGLKYTCEISCEMFLSVCFLMMMYFTLKVVNPVIRNLNLFLDYICSFNYRIMLLNFLFKLLYSVVIKFCADQNSSEGSDESAER